MLKPTAPSAAMATAPSSAACASVMPVTWARGASVRWRTTVRPMTPTASRSRRVRSAAGEATACADSAPATQTSSDRCGANTANAMTSTACATRGSCVPVSTVAVKRERLSLQISQQSGCVWFIENTDLDVVRQHVVITNTGIVCSLSSKQASWS